jgi:hypothetical protein
MGVVEIIGGIVTLLVLVIPLIIKGLNKRDEHRDATAKILAQAEYEESQRARAALRDELKRVQ